MNTEMNKYSENGELTVRHPAYAFREWGRDNICSTMYESFKRGDMKVMYFLNDGSIAPLSRPFRAWVQDSFYGVVKAGEFRTASEVMDFFSLPNV